MNGQDRTSLPRGRVIKSGSGVWQTSWISRRITPGARAAERMAAEAQKLLDEAQARSAELIADAQQQAANIVAKAKADAQAAAEEAEQQRSKFFDGAREEGRAAGAKEFAAITAKLTLAIDEVNQRYRSELAEAVLKCANQVIAKYAGRDPQLVKGLLERAIDEDDRAHPSLELFVHPDLEPAVRAAAELLVSSNWVRGKIEVRAANPPPKSPFDVRVEWQHKVGSDLFTGETIARVRDEVLKEMHP